MKSLNIRYFDRMSQKIEQECVYGDFFLRLLYENRLGRFLLPLVAKKAWFSRLYGVLQKAPWSKKKISKFVQEFNMNVDEFADALEDFDSFNAFFTRRLRDGVRPLADGAVMPADGRYLAIGDLSACDGVWVKGQKLDLKTLLGDEVLADAYADGALLIARLCPVDYHRFHFPFDCTPGDSVCINGPLYSVSPVALKRNLAILSENKRVLTPLDSPEYGRVLCIEVGATNVGSIRQTAQPHVSVKKGDEKGYFEFGGSCLMLLFEKGKMTFADDLLEYSEQGIEVRALMGQALCKSGNSQ